MSCPYYPGFKKERKEREEEREKWKERQRSRFLLDRVGTGFTTWDGLVFHLEGRLMDADTSPEPSLPASWPPPVSVYTN